MIGGIENTRSARLARKLYVGNVLTRGAGSTAVYLEEAVVKWSVIAVSAIIVSSVGAGFARLVRTIWVVCPSSEEFNRLLTGTSQGITTPLKTAQSILVTRNTTVKTGCVVDVIESGKRREEGAGI